MEKWGDISPHKKSGDKSVLSQYVLFCCKICFVEIYAVLLRNLFCRDLRAFVWRKIYSEIVRVEKKGQISGMAELYCGALLRFSVVSFTVFFFSDSIC